MQIPPTVAQQVADPPTPQAAEPAATDTAKAQADDVDATHAAKPDADVAPGEALPEPPGLSTDVPLRLAPIDGFDDDAAYRADVARRAQEFTDRAQSTDDPSARADLLMAAANLILAEELHVSCTWRFVGRAAHPPAAAPNGDSAGHGAPAALSDASLRAARAAELLEDAAKRLAEVDPGEAPDEDVRISQARRRGRLSDLQAFAAALQVYLGPEGTATKHDAFRLAASRLAPLQEGEDDRTVAAATFWQAVLRSHEEDGGAATALLDMPLSDPSSSTMPYGFFGRLLRCRLMGTRTSPAAAIALLMQMEQQCDDWFTGRADRLYAVSVIALVEIDILRQWHDGMPSEKTEERAWCLDRISRLQKAIYRRDNGALLRIRPAVPLLAEG